MEKDKLFGIGVAFVAIFLVGTFASPYLIPQREPISDKIGVVVTILPQADFVKKVGQDRVSVTVMVPPSASPHTHEPTPQQLVEVSKAMMYAKVGSGVEFELIWMNKIIEQNKKMLVVNCSIGITKRENDPHIWNSPINAKKMVENICVGLIEIDPDYEDYYTENRDRYLQELDAVDAYIHERLDRFTNRVFMIYHPAFEYFADEYNLTQLAIEHKGKPPTPKVIQDCIDLAKEYDLSCIFLAPQFATEYAEAIAHEISGRTVFIDPLPLDYVANMQSIAASLSLEMEG